MKQLKLISTGTILLLVFLTTFLISGALAAGPTLKLPTFPVTATYDFTNPWPAHLTLSGVGGGYDVQDNVSYNDWCVERVTQYPSQSGIPYDALKLYSSYDPNLPADLQMFGGRVIPWDQINWVLNNKGSYSGNTIQNAIWSLEEGQDIGYSDPDVPVLVNAAEANGTGFVPGPGQIIAVIVAQPPDGISTSSDNWQENIIEVTVPEPVPGISIVKYTNGQVANDPDGADVPVIKPGDPVTWTYVVTNTGNVPIAMADVSVTDDQTGVTPVFDHVKTGNTDDIFDPSEVWVYVASGVAVNLNNPPTGVTVVPGVCTHGQTQPPRTAYVNQGTASIPGATSTAKSSYCNPPAPGISIVKYTNGQVANDPNGTDVPVIKPGDPVTWTYDVTNTGQVAIAKADVSVTDDQTGVTPVFDHVKTGNTDAIFDPGEVWVYVASGVAVNLNNPPTGVTVVPGVCTHGQTQPPRTAYVNQGTASIPGATSTAKSSYCNPPAPGISIVKYTNGQVASDPDGADVPLIKPGDPVTWTYVVTNTGNVSIPAASVSVTDDQTGVTPVFDHVKTGNTDAIFDPGEVWVYVASGVAVNLNNPPTGVTVVPGVCTHGQTQPPRTAYVNQGTASIPGATSTAKSSYCNPLFKVYFPVQNGKSAILPQTWDAAVGFEDLPQVGANDFDYNDWVTDIEGVANFDLSANNGLREISFKFTPKARGAEYDHAFHIAIPHGTFASDGTAVMTLFDQNHQAISSQTFTFKASEDNDFIIFAHTSDVFPNLSNTIETKPSVPAQRYASLDITFNNLAPFDLTKYNFSLPHGEGLFFDPYLHVINTGDTIHRGDIRMLTVPDAAYSWPEEQIRIDYAYPKITFTPGNPPTIMFPNNWWLDFNHCVYGDGIPCVLLKAPVVGTVTPSTPTVTPTPP